MVLTADHGQTTVDAAHKHVLCADDPLLADLRILAGWTLLDDGSPVFLLDLNHVA